MTINFLVNEVFDGWTPTDTRLGGTEESVVRWASELVSRGHTVYVYQNGFVGEHGGATYRDRTAYRDAAYYEHADICINVKSYDTPAFEPTLYLTNETDAHEHDLSSYLGVIWPSEWALEEFLVNNPVKFVLPHGFDDKEIYPSEKVNKQCLYASSPDRGLVTLLRAWPQVLATHPDATLKVTYGAQEYEADGVEFLGEVDEDTLNQLYRESDVWCHPCNGGELYGITGIKAQAAGCVPVIIPTMALTETVKHGFLTDEAHYAQTLVEALTDEVKRHEIRQKLAEEHYINWSDSTSRLLEIIETALL